MENWERILFVLIGLGLLAFSFINLHAGKVTEASAIFVMAFISFVWSNLSRFKKFKGIGFEAELWEDKQKEAADLIDRLKNVVAIYTREIVLANIMRARIPAGINWKENWKLYDELIAQHNVLGQKIDFSDLKRKVDSIFLFDMCMPLAESVCKSIERAKTTQANVIAQAFEKDTEGKKKRISELSDIKSKVDDSFMVPERGNLADRIVQMAELARVKLKDTFSVMIPE